MEIDIHKKGKGRTPAKRKCDNLPIPVSPGESGKGFPYAPVDWPNPGDVWGWRVGWRVKGNGSYHDRFLIAPERFQKRPTKKLELNSKPHVERYLRSEFPDTDVDAFFASFTWDIQAEGQPEKKGKTAASPKPIVPVKVEHKMETGDGISKRTWKGRKCQISAGKSAIELALEVSLAEGTVASGAGASGKTAASPEPIVPREVEKGDGISRRTRKGKKGQISTRKSAAKLAVELFAAEGTVASGEATKGFPGTGCESGQICDSSAAISHDNSVGHSPVDCKLEAINPFEESRVGLTPEEFDSYLNSLDEILALPIATVETSYNEEGMIEARKGLSSLLALGYPNLVSSNKLSELTALASKLQNDRSLSLKEISMLNLIMEIPLTSKCFLEAKKVSFRADKFFADLDTKFASVASLRNEYNATKDEIEIVQAEEACALLKILDIDQQIASLKSLRQAQTDIVKVTNKKIVQFTSIQKRVMDSLPKIVNKVQVANSEKPEWELKKKKSADLVAKILAKFAPLERFSFGSGL